MKQEIRKIMQMNKEGKISDDQMIELIDALKSDDTNLDNKIEEEIEIDMDFSSSKKDMDIGSLITGVINGLGINTNGTNSQTMSKVDIEIDDNIAGNDINLSKVTNILTHDESVFLDNSINASNISKFELQNNSKAINNSVNATNIKSIKLDNSTLKDIQFNATKIKGLCLESSGFNDVQFNASKVDNCSFENCKLSDVQFNKVKLSNTRFKNLDLSQFEVNLEKIEDVEINSNEQFLKIIGSY